MLLSDAAVSRNNNFNLIRFVAAYAVLFSHSFTVVTGDPNSQPLMHRLGYNFGAIAVDIFFVSSGFLIAGSLLRQPNLLVYFKARFLRIYPALFVVTFVTVFVLGPALSSLSYKDYFNHPETWWYLLKNGSVLAIGAHQSLPGLFAQNPYASITNLPLWTLPFEVSSYIAIALLYVLFARVMKADRTLTAIFFIVLAVMFFMSLIVQGIGFTAENTLFRLNFFFFIGSAFYMISKHVRLTHSIAVIATALIAMGIIFPAWFHYLYTPLLAYLTLYLAYIPRGKIRSFNLIGDYSYGIYVYAFPVQQSLVFLIPSINITEMVLYTTLITLPLAIASWHIIEKRALSLKSKTHLHQ
jgi:peptidoglycan/LPS O-acetylase OafA/YrhL